MLEEKLAPVLTEMHKKRSERTRAAAVREWFSEHDENLADNLQDLMGLCKLPDQDRYLVTYPVIGNWYLHQLTQFVPQNSAQVNNYAILRSLIQNKRFHNAHWQRISPDAEEFNLQWDEANAVFLAKPEDAMPLTELVKAIRKEIATFIYHSPVVEPKTKLSIDPGHGIVAPSDNFAFLTWYFDVFMEQDHDTIDATIMVVDDEQPKMWYDRLIRAGFRHDPNQQGFFYNCESALKALRHERYDVILTDLELGKGRMSGIKFVERAYDLLKSQGETPRISVFSYDTKKLQEAEDRLRRQAWDRNEEPKVFSQVDHNNKTRFMATAFRFDVGLAMRRNETL